MRKEALALATFTGTIIGAGIFGLPYIAIQVGIVNTTILFALAGVLTVLTHLMYGEVASSSRKPHRLVGYCGLYLNQFWKRLAIASTSLGYVSALLAYMIIGGIFLQTLVAQIVAGPLWVWITVFWVVGALVVLTDGQALATVEFWCMGIFVLILGVVFAASWPLVELARIPLVQAHPQQLVLSYGIILFSLTGMSIIPELVQIVGRKGSTLRGVIIAGSIFSLVAYALFIVTISGVLGAAVRPDALTGLEAYLPVWVMRLLLMFGIVAVFTSFLALAETLKKQFVYDLRLPVFLAWSVVVLPPYALFWLGVQDFIQVMAFSGAVFIGIDILLVSLLYMSVQTRTQRRAVYRLSLPPAVVFLTAVLCLSGVVAELVRVLSS